jgi:hypothetical protein
VIAGIRSAYVRSPYFTFWLHHDERQLSGAVALPKPTAAGTASVASTANAAGYVGPDDVRALQVFAINAKTGAHSTYTNFPVNSLQVFAGRVVAALDDGLYELGGTTDAGAAIQARLRWAPSDLGSDLQKRIDAVILRIRRGGNGVVTALADETEEIVYPAGGSNVSGGIEYRRVDEMAKDHEGRHWQFGYDNQGADFELFDLEVLPILLGRRLKRQ